MCGKCKGLLGILFVVFGIIFLLQNLGVWNFWGIQWYTVLFIIGGFGMMCHAGCCNDNCCETPKTPTKPARKR